MGAGDRQVPHQIDEWVDLDQLIETAKGLYLDGPSLFVPSRLPNRIIMNDKLLDIEELRVSFHVPGRYRPGGGWGQL